ncbi:UvrD-helicase domain-containing protein [Frankia sp. AgB1.9]|uniref:UvrD-helicase domain-containing protein n=1 Tax=unclassified Frankia TaxID=2632575 RepID=UPI00193402A8|nr:MULTISPECIES: UvrD-helicase domain-containing protein [unclassified Frankia]MBL7487316.1 UvrD-helicase domain-containing protein [Frankia sp. AgW1.1]MBL7546323.1 UvrD-helicase domain-containing protein [Frankia sp. AgB1.9]MBL7618632.1 UvrD-helicase domain-containing protein [Frankia sp. AgB1.8]
MTARVSMYRKAEEELYKLSQKAKADYFNFCHHFRANPDHPGLDLKPLKGHTHVYRAKVGPDHRALLLRAGVDGDGTQNWLVIAVRDRKDVYDGLKVDINRITGEIECVDLTVLGDSSVRRADLASAARGRVAPPVLPEPTKPRLADYDAELLLSLGVAEALVDLALRVTTDAELDLLLTGAPPLSKDILYALAAGMTVDEVRAEITAQVRLNEEPDRTDLPAALRRTQVTAVDETLQQAIEEGDFRAWKVFLHPTQRRVAYANYRGPARVSGGPGTGKTIVALHRVKHLVEKLPPGIDKPILLTTYTANLAADLRMRLASLIEPALLARVDVTHIDQLAARVLGENTSTQHRKKRVSDQVAASELRQLLAEVSEIRWEAPFLFDEWDQVILGQSVTTRADYFAVRRAGRGTALTRVERNQVWKLVEQFTARLDKLGMETWGQAAERAARYETDRARRVAERGTTPADDDSSGRRNLTWRYRHIVVDEAQDLRAAHWKMLRAMANPAGPNDLFLAGDTHQRIYDHYVTLGPLGINIRGRSTRLTLSYRSTREILGWAQQVVDPAHTTYDDLDDGTDTLAGYRAILRGRVPDVRGYSSWDKELGGLVETVSAWRAELKALTLDPTGRIAVCVADRERVADAIHHLTGAGLACAELTKDGPQGDGDIHVGTMHRFKGLEYQKLAITAVSAGVIPRAAIDRYKAEDPPRYAQEVRKARSLLFVATTRARDTLVISWSVTPSPLLPSRPEGT